AAGQLFLFSGLPPPRLTPFPYTTLFRSAAKHARRCDAGGQPDGNAGQNKPRTKAEDQAEHVAGIRSQRFTHANFVRSLRHRVGQDRKSTRLNSSHVAISYAVLCLKKKTG